jgi:hypothetical protein
VEVNKIVKRICAVNQKKYGWEAPLDEHLSPQDPKTSESAFLKSMITDDKRLKLTPAAQSRNQQQMDQPYYTHENTQKKKKLNILRGDFSATPSVLKRRPGTGRPKKSDLSILKSYDMGERLDMAVFEAAGSNWVLKSDEDTEAMTIYTRKEPNFDKYLGKKVWDESTTQLSSILDDEMRKFDDKLTSYELELVPEEGTEESKRFIFAAGERPTVKSSKRSRVRPFSAKNAPRKQNRFRLSYQ